MKSGGQGPAGRLGLAAALLIFALPIRAATTPAPQAASPSLPAGQVSGGLPLAFEANQGQTDPRVRFLQRGSGHALFLTQDESVLALQEAAGTSVLRMRLLGGEPEPKITGLDKLPGRSNYLIGSDPGRWRTGIAQYARVRYENVYRGVDLVFHGSSDRLEYDLIVAPGADPGIIRVGFQGAGRLRLDERGDLILPVGKSEIVQHAPVVYQEIDGIRRVVPGKYLLHGPSEVGFAVDRAAYDPARPLVIDPVLSYSTYLGGTNYDHGNAIAVDASGSAYLTGTTYSTNFPLVTPVQGYTPFSTDIFVAKLDPSGSGLVYSTYMGGSDVERGYGVAVDGSGSAYVTGRTDSRDFPILGAFQSTGGAPYGDAFVAKLSPNGSALVYSSYLGGSHEDDGRAIAVDAGGSAHVVGFTQSFNFPVANPLQGCHKGTSPSYDAFVTKLSPGGSTLSFSTYVGGSSADRAWGVALDPAGNIYVTGFTESSDFPTVNALSEARAGSARDAFVLKIDASHLGFVYSTFLGGSDYDEGVAIAADAAGNTFVTGHTNSADFPLRNPVQPGFSSAGDGFVTKIDPVGSALVYSTYLGGSSGDFPRGIAVDAAGQAHVIGQTSSPNFPLSRWLDSTINSPFSEAFVTKLSVDGGAFVYSTYLGGYHNEVGNAIALDAAGNAHVAGTTWSYDFPTVNPFMAYTPNEPDAFVAKIVDDGPAPPPAPIPPPTSPSGRFEQDFPGLAYAGSWYSSTNCGQSHGDAFLAVDPSSSVMVTFVGTRIRWIGYRDEWSGIASVFLDGTFMQAVDTYASPAQYQAVLFEAAALDPGSHTLVIEVTGTHGAASSGAWIWADAFDVIGAILPPPIPDGDGDGVQDDQDCAPSDQDTWRAPSPAGTLDVSGGPTGLELVWQAPLEQGGTTMSYDVLRSADPAAFTSAECVATAISTTSLTVTSVSENEFYLVRSRNTCGGTLGTDSAGAERPGAACP